MIRKLRNPPRLLIAALLLGIAQPALAGVFCVDTAGGLQSALTTAAANGQDDEVRIVQGTYVGNFVYTSTEALALSVLGGYTAGCASRRLDPVNTILDGNRNGTVMKLTAPYVAAEFLVEGLTLQAGKLPSGSGGGLSAEVGNLGGVTVNHNRLENNTVGYSSSHDGGGGAYISSFTATLTNNSITGNTAHLGGGAIIYALNATLTNNSIMGNTTTGQDGGGAYISAITATLTNNSITGNTAYYGGGAYISATTTATLTNNTFAGNTTTSRGGGAVISAKTIILANNTLAGNKAEGGGGLELWLQGTETAASARLDNNLFWNNVATGKYHFGADLWIGNDTDGDYPPIPVTLLANNFDQSPTGFGSTLPITIAPTNLNQLDPLFVDASTGDHHLQPGSPMIDAGYPGTPDLPDFDIEGTPRVLGAAVDIGAYEYDDGSAKAILSIARAGNGSGEVTSNPSGIACGSDCFQIYDIDTLVTLTAKPNAGSVFAGWEPASCGEAFPLIEDTTCTANFDVLNPYGDVDPTSWAAGYIYAIRDAGITGGCGNGNYCPQGLVTREQMAAFLVRAVEGEPAANYCGGSSYFSDVAPDAWSCGYIKRLSELNITGGCGSGNYCPQGLVTRDQMAAFIVRAVEGEPPRGYYCDGVAPFQDVAPSAYFCRHIKRLAKLNVTQGCGNGNYCPYDTVNREQMAAFLARAFLDME